uniref:PID domain-containing protein n=1 Tax=Photinus pyralis TaxID=7054 RepID=A0A1Y1KBD9_PHOPY
MKLLTVHYMGFTAMDRRFSNPMLPWIVSEIRKRDCYERVSLGVEDGVLQAYNSDFELQFSHHVQNMSRFSQADIDPCTFLYLVRDDGEQLLYCYLFQALKASDVSTNLRWTLTYCYKSSLYNMMHAEGKWMGIL